MMPNNSSANSRLLSISRPMRAPRGRCWARSPLAICAVSCSNCAQLSRRSPSTSAVRAPRQRPWRAIRSGSSGCGASNQPTGAAAVSVVVLDRHAPGTRRPVETELAHAADEAVERWRGERRRTELVAGDAVILVGEILAVERYPPVLVVRREREPRVQQPVAGLVGRRPGVDGGRSLGVGAVIESGPRRQRA